MSQEVSTGPLECLVICRREPVAWLHDVVHGGDAEPDHALSFSPDSFPFDDMAGFRSLQCEPLFKGVEMGWRIECEAYAGGFCYSICDTASGSSVAFYTDSDRIEDVFMTYFLRTLINAARPDTTDNAVLSGSRPTE